MDSSTQFVLEDFESQINRTYVFHFPIEEVCKALTNKEVISKSFQNRLIFKENVKDSFLEEEGNEISFDTYKKHTISLKVVKVVKTKEYFQVKLNSIHHQLEFISFSLVMELFWDSFKDVTIFNGQVTISKSSLQEDMVNSLKKEKFFPVEEIDAYLKNTVKNLEQNESILVQTSIENLWNFLNQLQNISFFLNMPETDISNEEDNIIKITDKNNKNVIRLVRKEEKINDSTYILYLYSFDSLIAMPLQSIQIHLVKVNENITLIIYKHIMQEYIPYDALKSNSGCKQRILKKIKKILEEKKKI